MKLRIVVDTNVLLSGIFFEKGNEAQVLQLILEDKVGLLASLETLEELRETLTRPKFHLSSSESLTIFQIILGKSEVILNINEAEVRCLDRDDQKFLDCAHTGRADYMVTGDPDLLDIRQVGRTRILRAAQLIRDLKNLSHD
ncbi:putative toxin-antitoxin system toxin component, PIN family [Candidatus Bathyarchaeota archaeon]|nr:MAG: putative toxin-antitoxin system toxin component, PIN family [Candidatus Bathyarchaeota archaeon]